MLMTMMEWMEEKINIEIEFHQNKTGSLERIKS